MQINLFNDINIQISSDLEVNNFLEIKPYPLINTTLTADGFLKFHFLDNYSFDNLSMELTGTFTDYDIYYSVDNINWVELESELTDTSLELSFDEITASFIKIQFNTVTTVTISTIEILSDISGIGYEDYFKEYKKNEMKGFLTEKIFENTDIKNIYDNYIDENYIISVDDVLATYLPDDWSNYYTPDGVDDYILSKLQPSGSLTKFTFACSFRTNTLPTGVFFGFKSTTAGDGHELIYMYNGYLRYLRYNAASNYYNEGLMTTNVLQASMYNGSWASFAVVVDLSLAEADRIRFYLNGVLDAPVGHDMSNTAFNYDNPLTFGADITHSLLPYLSACDVKNIIKCSDAWTLTDAQNHHAGTILGNIDNFLFWYKCDETVAEMGSSPYTDRAVDSSGNNNHGTPTNITPSTFCNKEKNNVI